MIRGLLVVLEGIDGAGTTTQVHELGRRFTAQGFPSHVTAQPSSGPVGSLLRQILAGRLVVHGAGGVSAPGWATMALLFAADRQDHQEAEIDPNLHDGVNVLCDRYLYSSVVYQSVTAGRPEAARWIADINRHIRRPDLVLHLDVNAVEAQRRRGGRDRQVEIYDDLDLQKQLAESYREVPRLFPELNWVTIDGNQPAAEVTEACWRQIEIVRARGAPA